MNRRLRKALGLDHPIRTLTILCAVFAVHLAFPRYIIATESMVPSMPPGTYVIALRNSLLPSPAGKEEVVVFRPVEGISAAPWIHRIVASSGEQIIPPDREGRVDVLAPGEVRHGMPEQGSFTVPDSFVYQSGDSATSYHGLIPRDMIVGRAIFYFRLPWR